MSQSGVIEIDLEADVSIQQGTSSSIPDTKKNHPIWNHFKLCLEDRKYASCQYCTDKISRGSSGKGGTNTAMVNHLKRKHDAKHSEYLNSKDEECQPKNTKRQLTLEETLVKPKHWNIDDPKAVSIHYIIAEMIALDNEPISIVEREGFRRYSAALQRNYKVPGRNFFISKIIPDLYEKCKKKIINYLNDADFLSFSTDIWTETHSNNAFISLTAHWVSSKFEYKHCVLNSSHFPGSHTGEAIGEKLRLLFREWSISDEKQHLTIRDNAANMIKGLNDNRISNKSCFIHTLQLCIQDTITSQRAVSDMLAVCRKIETHFHHSAVACSRLSEIQKELGVAQHKFVQDVRTRWNSTYYMLNRILEQKNVIYYFAGEGSITNLNENQWELLTSMLGLLSPFEEITKITSESNAIISEVIPAVATLLRYLRKDNEAHRGVGTMKALLRESVQQRFEGHFSNIHFCCATFLDPRFKLNFTDQKNYSTIKAQIMEELISLFNLSKPNTAPINNVPVVSGNPVVNARSKTHSSFWECYSEVVEENRPVNVQQSEVPEQQLIIENEITAYLSKPSIQRNESSFQWWNKNSADYPRLAKLSRKYLSAPSSTVFSERLFSTEGNIYEDSRNRLLPRHGEMLTFLNRNLRLVPNDEQKEQI